MPITNGKDRSNTGWKHRTCLPIGPLLIGALILASPAFAESVPPGTDEEPEHQRSEPGERSPPAFEAIKVTLTLEEEPDHYNWTRYIHFNKSRSSIRIPVSFRRDYGESGWVWSGKTTAGGLAFEKLSAMHGFRRYWDKITIENHNQETELELSKVEVKVKYDDVGWLTIVKASFSDTTFGENDSVRLNTRSARERACAKTFGITVSKLQSFPEYLQDAITDCGKTGSDRKDEHPYYGNPKYSTSTGSLCAEFVTWYYRDANFEMTDPETGDIIDFDDMTGETNSAAVFRRFLDAGRAYYYDRKTREWRSYQTRKTYDPKPGDALMRFRTITGTSDPNGSWGKHSMMLVEWNKTDGVAQVVNGPWPVRPREQKVRHKMKGNPDFFFVIGRTN